MSLENGQKVVAFDFDGALNEYHGWNGGVLGEPIPHTRELVIELILKGVHVVVHTTRDKDVVQLWLQKHEFPILDVYNHKWRRIDVFVDDRAIQFYPGLLIGLGNEGVEWFADYLINFQPHWKQEWKQEGTED